MRLFYFLLLFPGIFLFSGCEGGKGGEFETIADQKAISVPAQLPGTKGGFLEMDRKIRKEGFVEFETDDLGFTRKKVYENVKQYGGYISSENAFKTKDRITTTMVVRIPADKFDAFLDSILQNVERIDRKDIRVEDVTEQMIDIEARLKTKKELEKRYLELLKQAKSVTEILDVERQLAQVRAEIESMEGRLNFLKNQTAYASLTIHFYERINPAMHFGRKMLEAFRNGWKNFIWFFVYLVNVWPFILIIFLFLIWKYYKKG